jgi:hypothetical protein
MDPMTKRSNLKRFGAYAVIAIAASAATFFAVRARAAGIPDANALTYTGYLEDPNGAPLAGKHSISVRFWASDAATKALCTGELADAELVSGRFQVPLPDDCTLAVKASPDTFVDVLVDGASLGRTKLGAVPYAIEAGHAAGADAATNDLAKQLQQIETDLTALKGNFGTATKTTAGPTNITGTAWTWLGGTAAMNVAAGERVLVWNSLGIAALDTASATACAGCVTYADGKLAVCYTTNNNPATPQVSASVTSVNPGAGLKDAGGGYLDEHVTVADVVSFAVATTNVQVGLCAARYGADSVHRDFRAESLNTLVVRAPVHGN